MPDGAEVPEESAFPILCLKISPRSAKYGKPLEHRDVLGTVMGLGITRDLIGDIIIREDGAYLFCVSSMADFLRESLARVGRTDTACVLSAPPEGPVRTVREVRVQVAVPCPVGEHWRVERDLRSRIKARFDREGIVMPHYSVPEGD